MACWKTWILGVGCLIAAGCPAETEEDPSGSSSSSSSGSGSGPVASSSSSGNVSTSSTSGASSSSSTTLNPPIDDDGDCGSFRCDDGVFCYVPMAGTSSGTTTGSETDTSTTTGGGTDPGMSSTGSSSSGTTGGGVCGSCYDDNNCIGPLDDIAWKAPCDTVGGADLEVDPGYVDDKGQCCFEYRLYGNDCPTSG